MSKRLKPIDAEYDSIIFVEYEDALEAKEKVSTTCGKEDRNFGCAIEVATLRQHPEFKAVRVDATVVNVQLRDESKPVVRWILGDDGKLLALLNDMSMEELLNMDWPLKVRFVSPIAFHPGEDEKDRMKRYTRSLAWGRSEEGKRAKRESAERRTGVERGSYNPPTGRWRDGRGMSGYYSREEHESD
jgi:hypothetical protein